MADKQASAEPLLSGAEWRSRGNAALARGQLDEAADCYRAASRADPADALAHLNLGFVCLEQGQAADAQKSLAQALVLMQPQQDILHDIHFLLGRAHAMQNDSARAIASFEAAVAARPQFAEAMEALARLLHESGRYEQALQWARRWCDIDASSAARMVIAQALHMLRREEDALGVLETVLAEEPSNPEAWAGKGNVMLGLQRPQEALQAFERALDLTGPTAEGLINLSAALGALHRFEEALQNIEQVLRMNATHRDALFNRTAFLLELQRVEAAAEAARVALAIYPEDADLHWHLAIAYLLQGRFSEGWREHEWRWKASAARSKHPLANDARQWSGVEDLRGKTILLFAEQGLGDSLQCLRYVPLVAARGARVLLQLPVMLHRLKLVSDLEGAITVLAPGEPPPSFDFFCPLLSLPAAFGSQEGSIPREVPYLATDPARVEAWKQRLRVAGKRLKVGLTWSGSSAHTNDVNRSIPLAQFKQLELAGCFFVSLQPEVRESDMPALREWPALQRWGEELLDFGDTAALVEALDLVVSVDTSVAHLAGALGRPVWILIPFSPDWRWMVRRTDSPWYPSARLFRQSQPRDWPAVLQGVRDALGALVAERVPLEERTMAVSPGPSWPELLQRAQAENSSGDGEAALRTLKLADAQAGPHPLTEHVRGNALFMLGRFAEAASAYEAALNRKGDFAEAAANAAATWMRLGQPQRALERAQQALRLSPGHVSSLSTRVIALQSLGRHSEALAAAHAAHQEWPEDAELLWTYGATALLVGEFAQGWPALEARWLLPGAGKKPDPAGLGCPAWTGVEPVQGRTLLLVAEQGFGDTLQFVRYADDLLARGARVVLWVPEALEKFIRASMPKCTVITRVQEAPRADFHVPMMSLPGAFGTRLDSIPAVVPYLRAEQAAVDSWRSRLPGKDGLRVGLVWSGNPAHANDRNRSLALSQLLEIRVPGVQFISLQRDVRPSDRAALQDSGIWEPEPGDIRSFADSATLAGALDLVISVDTSVAHLAGALGRPLWVLLPYRPDWRWLLDRDDSPWYPTARLFRQPAPGAWEPVLTSMRGALTDWASTRSA